MGGVVRRRGQVVLGSLIEMHPCVIEESAVGTPELGDRGPLAGDAEVEVRDARR